jgi:hypothetical protein
MREGMDQTEFGREGEGEGWFLGDQLPSLNLQVFCGEREGGPYPNHQANQRDNRFFHGFLFKDS